MRVFSPDFFAAEPIGLGGVQSFFSSPGSRFEFLRCSGSLALLNGVFCSFGRAITLTRGDDSAALSLRGSGTERSCVESCSNQAGGASLDMSSPSSSHSPSPCVMCNFSNAPSAM